jgi:hypothetical protein
MKLFELYEARKTRFSPGVIWEAKGDYVVQKLQIINKSCTMGKPIDMYRGFDAEEYRKSPETAFEILEVRDDGFRHRTLSKGRLISWPRDYMEALYDPKL